MLKLKREIKDLLPLLSIPLALLIIYLIVSVIWRIFELPAPDELIEITNNFFDSYGLVVVFVSALIEGFLLLGNYFPGGFVIFLGVISAGRDAGRAFEVVSVVSLAFFLAYYGNYLIGRYGLYHALVKFGLRRAIENSKRKLSRHGLRTLLYSYWEPNLASIAATSAGILKFPTRAFLIYSAISIIIWNIFWGLLVFKLGEAAFELQSTKYVLLVVAIWIAIIIVSHYVTKNLNRNKKTFK